MQVVGLFLKEQHSQQFVSAPTLALKRGYGVVGDTHAQPGSPRQVLLASTPALQQFGLKPGNLWENILVDGMVEALKSGQVIQVGAQALLRLTFLCEPCADLEQIQPGLSKRVRGRRGLLAMVVRDGVVQVGDALTLHPMQFPVLSEKTPARFAEFVARIPAGTVVRTADIILALGLTASHYRVIPIWMKKFATTLPVHRIVAIDGTLMTQHLPDQKALLEQEGVAIAQQQVHPENYWEPAQFHALE